MKLTVLFGIILWVCTVSVMGTVESPINDRRNQGKRGNRGGVAVVGRNTPPRPATTTTTTTNPPLPEQAPPANTPIDTAARKSAAQGRASARRADARSASSRIAASPTRGGNIQQNKPNIIRSDAQQNARVFSRGIFQAGKRVPSRTAPRAAAGKASQDGYEILVYFGDGFVILFGYIFIIAHDNTIDVFGTKYVVCGYSLGRVDATICCEKELIITYGDPVIQCCSYTYYRTNTEICCKGVPYDKVAENGDTAVCCGDVFYLPGTEFCCDNKPFPQEGFGCCNGVPYKTDERCCYLDKYLPFIDSYYCQPECVEDRFTKCCDGVEYRRRSFKKCCGTKYYNTRTRICCGGSVRSKSRYGCCDNQPYRKSTHQCCFNSLIIPKHDNCFYYAK